MAIKRGKELAKEKIIKRDKILKDIISIYENNTHTQIEINRLAELQSDLDNMYQNMACGALIRSRWNIVKKTPKIFII